MRTALINRKGGVGKSAVAIGLATTWAQRGRRVLLVDLDPQGTASRTLDVWGLEPDADAVLTGYSLQDATHKLGDPWHLDVLPASQSLAAWDSDPNRLNREWRLRKALDAATAYDEILIDCGPSLEILVRQRSRCGRVCGARHGAFRGIRRRPRLGAPACGGGPTPHASSPPNTWGHHQCSRRPRTREPALCWRGACRLRRALSGGRRPAEWWKKDCDPRLSRRYAAGSCGRSGVVITSLSGRSISPMEPSER